MSGNTNGGVRLPIPVRAINANDPSQSRIFPSLGSAAKFAKECGSTDCQPDRSIKRVLNTRVAYMGYYWSSASPENVVNNEIQTSLSHANASTSTTIIHDEDEFPFAIDGCNVKVRVTKENPRRVSVYDLIAAVTAAKDPHSAFKRLAEQHTEVPALCRNYTFSGQGQRPTPVTDVRGAVMIINVLPGPAAAKFRFTIADVFVRFMGGDDNMIAQLKKNKEIQQSISSSDPMRIFGEAVENIPKYTLTSPSMNGKYLCDFIGKKVVYLVLFSYEGHIYIKFGKSEKCTDRMDAHYSTYPNAVIYCIHEVIELKQVEDAFKKAMKYRNKLTNIAMNGQNFTEIVTDIKPDEAEEILAKIIEETLEETYFKDSNMMRLAEIKLREKELDIEKDRMTHQVQVIDMLIKAGIQGESLTMLVQKLLSA